MNLLNLKFKKIKNASKFAVITLLNIKYFSFSFNLIKRSLKNHIFCRTKFELLYKQKYSFKLFLQRALYICGAHRNSIVHGVDLNVCALCNKKRNGKKPRLAPMHMFTITYRYILIIYT